MKTDPIQAYILKSKRNLSIAADVADAWPEARSQLVSAFLGRLRVRLNRKLKGWKSEPWGGSFFVQRYAGFCIWKPGWEDHAIGFECGEYGDRMVIGIGRDIDNTRKQPFRPELLSAVQTIHPTAKSDEWWEARLTLRYPEPDWRKPDVLWRIHKDPAFLTAISDQLLEIVKVSEHIIDRLVSEK